MLSFVAKQDKTLNLYLDGYHQPFIDINREKVFNDLAAWLEAHVERP